MRVEAVTVCIGYGDFLAETARHNEPLFDNWIVVTLDSDEETREVCRRHSIRTLLTGDYRLNGEAFNKGRLIERGLALLGASGWRVHLDADVCLPAAFRNLFDAADPDPSKIYGADRIMIRSAADWHKLKASGWTSHSHHCLVKSPAGFEIGTRWSHHEYGYVPIGYFQMWHSQADQWRGTRHRTYPTQHNDACRTDVQFALQWDRRHRELLPEFYVAHLESQLAANGANWCGRTTKPFIPYGE